MIRPAWVSVYRWLLPLDKALRVSNCFHTCRLSRLLAYFLYLSLSHKCVVLYFLCYPPPTKIGNGLIAGRLITMQLWHNTSFSSYRIYCVCQNVYTILSRDRYLLRICQQYIKLQALFRLPSSSTLDVPDKYFDNHVPSFNNTWIHDPVQPSLHMKLEFMSAF